MLWIGRYNFEALWQLKCDLYVMTQGNKRSAGFTIEERKSFETNFLERGFVDTFRKQHPNVVAYSYWGYRHGGRRTNKGMLTIIIIYNELMQSMHSFRDVYCLLCLIQCFSMF